MITRDEYNLLKRIKDNGKELPEAEMSSKEKRILKKLKKKGLVEIREYRIKEVSENTVINIDGIWEPQKGIQKLDKVGAIDILSGLVRSMELGDVVLNEYWQQNSPEYCKTYQENIVPFYRAAINILAGLDQSANWIDVRDLCRISDSQKTCTNNK